MNDTLKIVRNVNIDINETLSNLITSSFGLFLSDIAVVIQQIAQQPNPDAKKQVGAMMTIKEAQLMKQQQDSFILFKNMPPSLTMNNPRISMCSDFCFKNKRVINKLIRQKPQAFLVEIDSLIRDMPHLLDFDNKRWWFKQELKKLKRAQYHEQVSLYIRRDDIFMDSYA